MNSQAARLANILLVHTPVPHIIKWKFVLERVKTKRLINPQFQSIEHRARMHYPVPAPSMEKGKASGVDHPIGRYLHIAKVMGWSQFAGQSHAANELSVG